MSHYTQDEIEKIKEEQQIRTGTTIRTVVKAYFGFVGAILLFICLAVVLCGAGSGIFILIARAWQGY